VSEPKPAPQPWAVAPPKKKPVPWSLPAKPTYKDYFRKGQIEYKAGRFASALKSFKKASRASDGKYFLLYYIAQAYRLSGNKKRAYWKYREFLQWDVGLVPGVAADEDHLCPLTRELIGCPVLTRQLNYL
jgi:hypothetical protein